MSENDLSPDKLVKDVISRIVACTGEPYSVAPVVADVLYAHLGRICTPLVSSLQGSSADLANLLLSLRHSPLQLARVMQYFIIIASTNELASYANANTATVIEHYPESQEEESACLQPLTTICDTLGITLPSEARPYAYSAQLAQGRQLRLSRIDFSVANLSVDEYLKFAKMRQTGSFLYLCRPSLRAAFTRWLLAFRASGRDESRCSINNRTLCVIAHLMTGSVLDVIDTTFFYRPKVGIDLRSPLTPIELQQAIRRVQPPIHRVSLSQT